MMLLKNFWKKENKEVKFGLTREYQKTYRTDHNDYIFIGTYDGNNYSNFKTARTNYKAINFLKERFPKKKDHFI